MLVESMAVAYWRARRAPVREWLGAARVCVVETKHRTGILSTERRTGGNHWARGIFARWWAVDEKTIMEYIENQKWDEDDQGFKITAPTEPRSGLQPGALGAASGWADEKRSLVGSKVMIADSAGSVQQQCRCRGQDFR
jgi:hypothetical protein